MAAKPKEKFEAAVKVIQSLPKNGSFQPSNELLLKFYGYYKQATLGPCRAPKPAFYDIVGKAKWDAWNKLGKMPTEEAMLSYVEELKKIIQVHYGWRIDKERIVEAMPHTAMVAEFVEKLGTFYEMVDDKEALLKKKSSKAGMPNGDAPRENGKAGVEHQPASPENGVAHQENGVARRGSGVGSGDTPPTPSASEESSESLEVSPDSSPEHVVQSSAYTLKSSDSPKPSDDDSESTPNTVPEVRQNLIDMVNGERGRLDSDGLTDSEGEEFCDTTDLPDDQLESMTPSPTLDSSHCTVTTATVHHTMDDEPISQSPDCSLHQPISDLVACRGGGDSSSERQVPEVSSASLSSTPSHRGRGALAGESHDAPRSMLLTTGGAGGGGRDPVHGGQRTEVSEQIAVALVRLQQDMNSVLARLNTLEALSVAQHQMHRSRQNSESDRPPRQVNRWWWPFPQLDTRSVFFIMAWPLIVHWVLTVISRRRHRRR